MYIHVLENMYKGSYNGVKSMYKKTENFKIRVNVHQGSDLSPYLFLCSIG